MVTVKLDIKEVSPGMILAESVYFPTSSGNFMLIARKGAELDDATIQRLDRNAITSIEIIAAPQPITYIEDIPPVEEIIDQKLKEEAVDSVRELFSCVSPEGMNKTTAYQCVSNLETVVGDLLHVIA
ncbi:MAG: hypothetical protein FWD19_05550, partial [Defluviitaleaceae bacterium]|nr:hypothetical protein [Defluviitaleaceae bacterium]